MNEILLYAGAAIVTVWGISHLYPTEIIVKSFGGISQDNQRILRMEWIAEGVGHIFIGTVVFLATIAGGPANPVSRLIYWAAAAVSLVVAVLTLLTGSRTYMIPAKICPAVMTLAAALFLAGSLI
jgi:hypothetical protein